MRTYFNHGQLAQTVNIPYWTCLSIQHTYYPPCLIVSIQIKTLHYISIDSLTSLFILQPEDHRPMWYIHTITGEIDNGRLSRDHIQHLT